MARSARIEGGDDVDVRTFVRILSAAGLRLLVIDADGVEEAPMPSDVFRDRAGRRKPSHLDVHAWLERPTMKMLLRSVDPVEPRGSWYHLRPERDRLRGPDEYTDDRVRA